MHVGTQQFTASDHDLEFLARHGVTAKNENVFAFNREYGWDVEELIERKQRCAKFGIDFLARLITRWEPPGNIELATEVGWHSFRWLPIKSL